MKSVQGNMGVEFEEKLIGMNKEEVGIQEVDFPETHPNPILKGKKVEFRITIKDIKERVLAELNDEFAKDVGEEFKTLDDLKDVNKRAAYQAARRTCRRCSDRQDYAETA